MKEQQIIDLDTGESMKPPLGLTPEHIWIEFRISDLCDAIKRQLSRRDGPNLAVLRAYCVELDRHTTALLKLRKGE